MMRKEYIVPIDFMEHPVAARMFLKPQSQKIYWKAVDAIARMEPYIEVPYITNKEWWDIAVSIAFDFPQFFYWRDWNVILVPNDERKKVNREVNFVYFYNRETAQRKMRQIDFVVDEIISKCIRKNMTEKDMIYSIHNYLAHHVTYTKEKDPKKEQTYPSQSYTLETLLHMNGVCRGVSISNIYILRRLQIECAGDESQNHAWNIFKLRTGEILFSDTTWDINHKDKFKYYLLSEEEMSRFESHKLAERYPKKIVSIK